MLSWFPNFRSNTQPTILCLGAHSDDIEIGCGGLLLQLSKTYSDAVFRSVVFCSTPEREDETRRAHERLLSTASNVQVDVLRFRNSYFPYQGIEIKEQFERLKAECEPDLVLTHYQNDRHQDHRLISELTWNTYRDHAILEYEIPKFDGDLGQPNVFVSLSKSIAAEKTQCLLDCFPSQKHRQWFTDETFRSLLRLRGIECNAEDGLAEAFYVRKLKLHI